MFNKVFIVFRQFGYDTPEIMGVFLCRPDAAKLRESLDIPEFDCCVWIQEETVIGSGG